MDGDIPGMGRWELEMDSQLVELMWLCIVQYEIRREILTNLLPQTGMYSPIQLKCKA